MTLIKLFRPDNTDIDSIYVNADYIVSYCYDKECNATKILTKGEGSFYRIKGDLTTKLTKSLLALSDGNLIVLRADE